MRIIAIKNQNSVTILDIDDDAKDFQN